MARHDRLVFGMGVALLPAAESSITVNDSPHEHRQALLVLLDVLRSADDPNSLLKCLERLVGILRLTRSKNPALSLDCLLLAIGSDLSDGGEADIRRRYNLSKGAVTEQVDTWKRRIKAWTSS